MKYWDTSAIVSLLLTEEATPAFQQEYQHDNRIVTWWGTSIECVSAIARQERENRLSVPLAEELFLRLESLSAPWLTVQPSESIRLTARRLVRNYPLKAADAFQLAAAIEFSQSRPGFGFLTGDKQLRTAASREGFRVFAI